MLFQNKYSMNMKTADATLQNIFDACNVSHNSVPFDKIMLRSRAETKTVELFRYLATLFLIFAILTPLFFSRDDSFVLLNKAPGQPVVVTDHQLYDTAFTMCLMGKDILYDEIKATKEDGAIIFPKLIDKNNGIVTFPYDGSPLTIVVPAGNGYSMTAILSENKN